jgi:3D (Asp-Asp-Asp) domain-containing protein
MEVAFSLVHATVAPDPRIISLGSTLRLQLGGITGGSAVAERRAKYENLFVLNVSVPLAFTLYSV